MIRNPQEKCIDIDIHKWVSKTDTKRAKGRVCLNGTCRKVLASVSTQMRGQDVEARASPVTLFCRFGLLVGPPVDFDWRLNLQVLRIVFRKRCTEWLACHECVDKAHERSDDGGYLMCSRSAEW
jgi:hypothetical protein